MDLTITNESVDCSDGFALPAYLSRPASSGRVPALLFVYEIFGLTTEMQRVANDFAKAGYAVLIPDLFRRGSWFSCVRKFMSDLKKGQGRSVQDLLDARQWLSQRDFVDADHIAVIGFCMGGGFALVLAKSGLFSVAAPFYGQAPAQLDGACPIVASYGAKDVGMRGQFQKVQSEVERLKIPADLKLYPEAGHSFMNRMPNRWLDWIGAHGPLRTGYHAETAADATARVLAFLSAHR